MCKKRRRMGGHVHVTSTKLSYFLNPPPCHCHIHATYQFSCLLLGYPLAPYQCGRHMYMPPRGVTAASLWFRNNVSPPGCLTILSTIQWHGHKFWGGVRKNLEGAAVGEKPQRRGCLPNLAASERGVGLQEVLFGAKTHVIVAKFFI